MVGSCAAVPSVPEVPGEVPGIVCSAPAAGSEVSGAVCAIAGEIESAAALRTTARAVELRIAVLLRLLSALHCFYAGPLAGAPPVPPFCSFSAHGHRPWQDHRQRRRPKSPPPHP